MEEAAPVTALAGDASESSGAEAPLDTDVSNLSGRSVRKSLTHLHAMLSGSSVHAGGFLMDRAPLPSTLAWLDGRDQIATVAWHDPDVTTGFSCTDTYVETYLLPLLGPSATWALRRIGGWLASAPDSGLWRGRHA
jgi:hypothetical protein